jgi:hypothetical protein
MSEERYRIWKLVLLSIFVSGSLFIGWQLTQIAWQSTQNGRYVQFDQQKDAFVLGATAERNPTQFIDTRTGVVRSAQKEQPR